VTTTVYTGAYLPVVAGDAGAWGNKLNTQTFVTFDAAIGGYASQTLTNADVTLSATQSGMAILRLNGTLAANVIVTTTRQGLCVVENSTSGAYTVTYTTGTGASVVVPQGAASLIATDATNGAAILSAPASSTTSVAGIVALATDVQTLALSDTTHAVTPSNLGALLTSQVRAFMVQSVTASSNTLTIDASLGWNINVTLSHAVTAISFTNLPATGTLFKGTLRITNGGTYTMAGWPGTSKWPGGTVPTISSGAGKIDYIMCTTGDGGTYFDNFVIAQNLS
jgi:hypothetical protein